MHGVLPDKDMASDGDICHQPPFMLLSRDGLRLDIPANVFIVSLVRIEVSNSSFAHVHKAAITFLIVFVVQSG